MASFDCFFHVDASALPGVWAVVRIMGLEIDAEQVKCAADCNCYIMQELRSKVEASQVQHAEMLRRAQDICIEAEDRATAMEKKADKAETRAAKAEAELKEALAEAKHVRLDCKVQVTNCKER